MKKTISRRDFLKGSAVVTGLTVAVSITPFGYEILNASETKGDPSKFKPNAWFEITPDNIVTIAVPNSEMGQGIRTALPMMVADELEADWEHVRIIQAPGSREYKNPLMGMQITVASASCRGFYMPLRSAGAAGRAMLIQAAVQKWNCQPEECKAVKGTIRNSITGKSFSYGELCLEAARQNMPGKPVLKKESEFRYMGKPMPRVDIPEKVNGTAVFGFDVEVPDMHYAVLARPPAYGAKPVSFDKTGAQAVKGVKMIVPGPRGIAVCADSLDAAWKGRDALKVKWSKGKWPDLNTESLKKSLLEDLNKKGAKAQTRGDAGKAVEEADKKMGATYYVPCIAHATMEPMNCTASVKPDRCDVWVPTQGQTIAQMVAAKISGLPPNKVHIHTTLLGCGLGRRSSPDFVMEAVMASKALGKPVKVIWTREEDIKYDNFRAAMAHRIRAGMDENGVVNGWSHKVSSLSIMKASQPRSLKNGMDYYILGGLAQVPFPPLRDSKIAYDLPNLGIELVLSDFIIPVSPWRSIQNAPHAFVIESFIDELAYGAGKDPLEFRLQNLKNNKRASRALKTVAEKAGWGKPLPKGIGRGIAQHQCMGSSIAQVAEVSVDQSNGTYRVNRVVVAVDCGPVINPDPLVAQIEGAVTLALSTVLKEEIQFSGGGVVSENFEDYDVIRMSEVPDIEVHIIDSKDKIGGIGEPGIPPLAPAVANAIYKACGARIRRLPITPESVLSALKG